MAQKAEELVTKLKGIRVVDGVEFAKVLEVEVDE